jgi:apolipoprotein N-acyltransferase
LIRGLADRTVLAEGGWRALVAFLAGAVGALAMPPFGAWPALAVSLVLAVWLLDGSAAGGRMRRLATTRRAAVAGWFWGFGYFVAGLWWLGAAFLVEADVFAWLLPFGVLGLPALLAFFPALGFALAAAFWFSGPARLLLFALALTFAEFLRGHLFTGFPWNTLGMALGQNLQLMQSASVLGVWGLCFLAILLLATPALFGTETSRGARVTPILAAGGVLALMLGFGAWRLGQHPNADVPNVTLRIMQPNLAQDAKFRASNGPAILKSYLALSDRSTSPSTSGLSDVDLLIWPESAFPFLLHREPHALAQIATLLPPRTTLITGAARQAESMPGEQGGRYFNAVQVVDTDGAITATYDKIHLVPFGEYVPHALDAFLRALGIRQFVHIPGGFVPGERRAALRIPGFPDALPTICYEAIFPEEIRSDGPRPGWILNLTNDGWFGDTPGPYQHLAQARLRAVEQGLPLVRAANTGVSAVIDPLGRVVASLPLGQQGVLDAGLPAALPPPIAARLGNGPFLVLVFGGFAMLILRFFLVRRRSGPSL